MKRSVLTILIGLVVLLGALVSGGFGVAWAKGKTLWSGVVSGETVQITSDGVFFGQKFVPAYRLSDEQKCVFGLQGFPSGKWMPSEQKWAMALTGINYDWLDCQRIRKSFVAGKKIVSKGFPNDAVDIAPTIDLSAYDKFRTLKFESEARCL